jgi:hypothetical protein
MEDQPMKSLRQIPRILISAILLACILVLPATAAAVSAAPVAQTVLIDGAAKKFEAYMINGNSFFRLRDIAYALNGTTKQFEVSFDGLNNQIDLLSNTAYTPIGGEMVIFGSGTSVTADPTSYNVYLDGTKLTLTAYIIGAYNYIKLRDLAAAVNFGVTYQPSAGAIAIDTSVVYTPELISLSDLHVSMIGDSIGVGIDPYLKKLLPKLDNNSKVSRQFSQAKEVVQQMLNSGTLANTVIIELGTNGTISEKDMRALIELIGSSRKIVFVNCQVPRSWGVIDNNMIAKVTPDYPNTIIADWYNASLGNSSYLAKDGFHPTTTGAKVLSQLIADAVQKIQ